MSSAEPASIERSSSTFFHRVHDRRVVAAAEFTADLGQRAGGELLPRLARPQECQKRNCKTIIGAQLLLL